MLREGMVFESLVGHQITGAKCRKPHESLLRCGLFFEVQFELRDAEFEDINKLDRGISLCYDFFIVVEIILELFSQYRLSGRDYG